jgi:hypothetical protein
MSLIKVKDHPSLVRDAYSKNVLSTDTHGYNTYLEQRERLKRQQTDIESMKQDIQELKDLLLQIASKLQGKV